MIPRKFISCFILREYDIHLFDYDKFRDDKGEAHFE